MSSQAASISAWYTVLDWPSIVATFSVSRHGPASSSAARRNTAARSGHGVAAQSRRAPKAAAIAWSTWSRPAVWTSARTWSWRWGAVTGNVVSLLTRRPAITIGASTRSLAIVVRRSVRLSRSGLPGA